MFLYQNKKNLTNAKAISHYDKLSPANSFSRDNDND